MLLPGLKRQRDLAALTLQQLADKAHISRQTIWRLEKGGQATPTTTRRLAKALGCTPRDLLTQEDS